MVWWLRGGLTIEGRVLEIAGRSCAACLGSGTGMVWRSRVRFLERVILVSALRRIR